MKVFTSQNKKAKFSIQWLSFLFFGVMLMCSKASLGQIFTEDFSYPVTTLLSASGNWNAHSGAGTNALTVTSPGLTYTGYPGSGVGNSVSMVVSGEDDNRPFTAVNSGSVYASLLVNVATAGTGDYFTGLYLNTSTFPVRIYTKTATGGFNFGISKTNGTIAYESTVRTIGTTYLLMMSYVFNTGTTTDDIVNLWVNPTLGGTEPAATLSTGAGTTDLASISAFYLRQGSSGSSGTQRVDAIRVGTTWAAVNPPAASVPVVSPASLNGTVGTLFTTFQVVASNTPITSWAIASGTIAPGLSFNTGNGQITGTPTAFGSFSIDVNATNAAGQSASPGTISFTIAMGNQAITGLPATDTRTYTAALQQYNLSATGGGSGNPVTYSSDAPGVASVVGNQVTINAAGIAHITASQAGNSNWNAATPVQQTLTVNQASQTITFGALANRNDVDANFQLTGSASSGLPVTYVSSNPAIVQIVNSGGTPDVNGDWVDITGPGTATITASQSGNTNYLPATSVPQSQFIINTSLLNQTITFGPLSNKTYGDANFQLTATGGGSGNPVTYTSSDPSVATIVDINGVLDPNGTYVKIIGPGTTSITASQAGNGSYNAAVPVSQNFTVDKKTLTVSNATVDPKVYDGGTGATISNATLNGVINPDIVNIATSTGTFADPNVNNGIAVTAALTLGGADAVKYLLTQPTGLAGNITKAPQTINFTSLPDKAVGDPNFNLTATATSGLPVSYTSSAPSVASVNGVNGVTVHIVAVGSTTITASQPGDQNYFAATPIQQTQNVNPAIPVGIFANPITDANPSATNPFVTGQTFNSNITVSGISRGTGITASAAANRFSATGWNSVALDADDYFEFTLTPNPGYKIDFSNLVYTSQASGTGPTTFSFRSSVDAYGSSIASPVAAGGTISLAGASFQGVSTPITFRLYGWGASAAGGTFSVNDFTFNGNVSLNPPSATFVATNISVCGGSNDGTITLTPSGTGPFIYSWTGVTGSGNPATTPFSAGNVSSLTGLNIGYYNVTITDANLNTATITGIHIGYAYSVYVTNSGSISSACGNTGTIILYGNAGVQPYSYSLNGTTYQPGNTFTGLAAGPYTAYVKDAAGCISTKSVTVAAAAAIVVSPFVRGASSCSNDGSIEVYRTGGIPPYTYSKDGTNYQASYVFSGLAAGPYTLYVKDSKGCVGSQSATVTQGAALSVTANKTNASLCTADGTIQLNATGGVGPYTYSIDDGANYQPGNSFTGLSANTYPTKVKDSKGCTGSLNVTINLNPIVVTAFSAAASSCAASDGSIQLFRTGGVGPYTYSLDGNNYQNSNTFTGLTANYYEGFVKDSKGCVGELIDIYVGPDCGQRGVPLAKNADVKDNQSKVIANSALKLQVYPNPTATEFTLQLQGYNNDRITIIVTDIMGRRVYQAEGNASQQYRFGNKFNAGLYNVEVIRGNDKKTIRLVKE